MKRSLIEAAPSRRAGLCGSLALGLICSWAQGQTQFKEFAGQLPPTRAYTAAVALGDVDGDGDLDLFAGNGGEQSRLFLNDGKGRFTDVTTSHLPIDGDFTDAAAFADLDGDRDLDLVIGNFAKRQNRLYLNDGKGRFTDATAARLPVDRDDSLALAIGDVDGDKDLDLVFGNWPQQNRLYLNDGHGKFTDATATHLPAAREFTVAVTLGDVDGDKDLDLFFGNDVLQRNRLYLNDGKGKFADVSATHLPTDSDTSYAPAFADFDRDGDLDLVVGNWQRQNRFYVNDGKGKFAERTSLHLPADQGPTGAVAVGDVDGDRDLDLVFGEGFAFPRAVRNRLYINRGDGRFWNYSDRLPANNEGTNDVAMGDVDGDQDPDLVFGVFGNKGQNRLLLNLERQLHAPLPAALGRTYRLDFFARPGEANSPLPALPFIATAEKRLVVLPIGTFGLDPTRMIELPLVVIPPAGTTSLSLSIPNFASLVGTVLSSQALLIPDPRAPLSWRLTNVTADKIGR